MLHIKRLNEMITTVAERGQSDVAVKRELKEWAETTCQKLIDQKVGCGWYYLGPSKTTTGGMAIVMGWSDGFDNDNSGNPKADGSWRICTKLAYNCDGIEGEYGIDWEMPYDEATGDVDDTDGEYFGVDDVYYLYNKWKKEYKA